jgi:hypothetical protein
MDGMEAQNPAARPPVEMPGVFAFFNLIHQNFITLIISYGKPIVLIMLI